MAMEVVEGRHGSFLCQDNDLYVGRSLVAYGEYSEAEVALLAQILEPGAIVVEGGANIGALTVPIARMVGAEGRVHAFEPQRLVHQMLCGNLALNTIENVYAYNLALGERRDTLSIPVISYGAECNYGGVALGSAGGERVSVITVDDLALPRLDLLMADVEGYEAPLLRGARATIERCRPMLYLENDRPETSPELLALVLSFGYEAWWHLPPMYSPDNFNGSADNLFGTMVSVNILCLPPGHHRGVGGGDKVTGVGDWPATLARQPASAGSLP